LRIHLVGRTRLPWLPGLILSLLVSGCIAFVAVAFHITLAFVHAATDGASMTLLPS
jgi:ABC-type iron transport system FetAB permease component